MKLIDLTSFQSESQGYQYGSVTVGIVQYTVSCANPVERNTSVYLRVFADQQAVQENKRPLSEENFSFIQESEVSISDVEAAIREKYENA